MLLRALVYGLVGWAAEIAWTAVADFATAVSSGTTTPEAWRLTGRTYLWMLPIYGLGGLAFERVHARVRRWPAPLRGALYVAGTYLVEAATGALLRACVGCCPWDYGDARFAVAGLIRLDYAPLWLAFAFALERLGGRLGAVRTSSGERSTPAYGGTAAAP